MNFLTSRPRGLSAQAELLVNNNNNNNNTDALLQSFTQVDVCDAFLLDAPLFHGSELDKSWNGCCGDLARAAERLRDKFDARMR